jgi:RHS repeat-associated protein
MGAVYALDVDANGKLYVIEGPASLGSHIIRRIESPIPGFNAEDILIASMDGNEMYVFAPQGRHKQTVNVLTGAIVHTFNYDGEGRLTSILDGDGNLTTIDRDIDGNPTAIVAPGNQTTTLALNAEGYLQTITNPASETTSMAYNALGMLKTFTDPMGNTSTFTYDGNGRLIENDDGSGGVQTFSRVESQTEYTVTRTTAMGKVTTYRLEYLANGSQRSTVTGPHGDQTIVHENFTGTTEETQSDGTIITRGFGPDPRFGMQSPVPQYLKIEAPNVGTSEIIQTRTVVMTDESNPLSLETLQDDLDINGRVFTDHYDAATRTFTKTSPQGHQVVSVIDEQGRITSLTGAIGLDPETFTYDDKGRLEQKNRGTESVTLGYDTKNLPITHTNAAGHVTTYEYDDSDRVSQMTKADGQVLFYDYDANGNQTGLEMPSADNHVMSFSRRDLRTGYTPPGNAPYTRVYDNDRDLLSQSLPGGRTLANVFDDKRRWMGMDYPEASVDYIYDGTRDRLAGLDRTPTSIGAAQQIDYLYYGSLPFRSTWIGAATGRYTYFHNTDLQVSHVQLKISGIPQVDLPVTWDLDGNQTGYGPFTLTRAGPGGALSQVGDANLAYDMAYDTLGRLDSRAVTVNSLSVYDFTLTFNNLGKIIGKDETVNGVNHVYVYTYDNNGRLTNVTRDAVQVESFTYDDNDNRTGTLTASSTYDAQDRITSHDGVAYTVDVDGFLSARGPDTFQYSARGELIGVVLPGPTEITYSYDGMGRRVARTDASGTTEYLYGDPRDPLLLTAVRDTAGDLTVLFHHPVAGYYAMQRDGTTYYLATDQVGSPRVVTDTTGSVVKVIEYDSFGGRLNDTNPEFELHIGYAGGLEDTDTGLVRFGYRDYDQAAGRWTARDPLLYGGGQANLYAYSYNNPVTYKDPSGLWCAAGYLYDIIGGGIEVCCKNGDCSVCAEAGIGIGAGLDAGEGNPKDPGTRPFAEAGAGCGPAGGGMKCEFGGKCGTKCSAEGGVGPFKLNTEDEKGGGVGSGADNGDDGKLGKCGFNAKAGARDCKRF